MIKIATVKFQTNAREFDYYKNYDFKFDEELGVEVGDKVVVNCKTGYQCVEVTKIEEREASRATGWVVCKIDFSAQERREKIEAIEKKLKVAIESASIKERALVLAQSDKNISNLLSELEAAENYGK